MEDVGDRITEKVQALSDIELAILICLITEQHCIIEAERQTLDFLVQEIQVVCSGASNREILYTDVL